MVVPRRVHVDDAVTLFDHSRWIEVPSKDEAQRRYRAVAVIDPEWVFDRSAFTTHGASLIHGASLCAKARRDDAHESAQMSVAASVRASREPRPPLAASPELPNTRPFVAKRLL